VLNKNRILAIAAATLLSTSAQAADHYYGASFASLDYSEDGMPQELSFQTLSARLGTNINENFSAEFRAGFGIGDDQISVESITVDAELNKVYGLYVRGGFQATEALFPYAIIGYTRGTLKASAMGYSDSESENDTSFGVGVDFEVKENIKLNAEYLNMFDKDGADVDGFSVGFTVNF